MDTKHYTIACGIIALRLCADTTWTGPNPGDWNNSSNWSAGIPTESEVAHFPSTGTINVSGGSFPVGTLSFDNTSTTYTLSGIGTLNLYTSIVAAGSDSPLINCPLALPGSSTVAVTLSVDMQIGGALSGSAPLSISGAHNLTLSGSNGNYSGEISIVNFATLISGGTNTLPSQSIINFPDALGSLTVDSGNNSVATINDNGTITLTASSSQLVLTAPSGSYSGTIGGAGGLSITSLGVLEVKGGVGSLSYTGNTNISNFGILSAGADNAFAQGSPVYIGANGELDLNGNNNIIANLHGTDPTALVSLSANTLTFGADNNNATFYGSIQSNGSGSLDKVGSGTFTLMNALNTYTGTTTVDAGVFQAGGDFVFSAASAVQLNGTSHLDLNGFTNQIADLNGVAGTLVNLSNGSNNGTLILAGTEGLGPEGTFFGRIQGGGGLTIENPGTFTLQPATSNTYTGTTFVSGAFLAAGVPSSFAPLSAVVLSSGGLELNGHSNTILSLTGDSSSLVNLGTGSAILTIGDSTSTIYAGRITSLGTGGITKQGSGTLELTNNGGVTYSGPTTVNAGTLQASLNALSPNSAVTIAAGATLDISPTGGNNTILSLTSTFATAHVTLGANTLYLGSGSYFGTINGLGGGITKTSSSTLIFSGSGLKTYTGTTMISGGSLQASSTDAFSAGSLVSIGLSGTLDLSGNPNKISNLTGAGNVTLGNGTLSLEGSSTQTFTGLILKTSLTSGVGNGGLTIEGGGTLTLGTAGSDYTGTTIISSGVLKAGIDSAFSSDSAVTLSVGGTLNNNSRFNEIGTLSGSGGSILLGAGTLTINQTVNDSYAGSITGITTAYGGITKIGSETLTLSGSNVNTYGGTTTITAGILQAGNNYAFSPNSTVNVTTTLDLNSKTNVIGALEGTGTVTLGTGGDLTTGGNGTSTSFSGTISGTGNVTQTVSTLTFGASNSYIGTTTINGNGIISISNDNQLGNVSNPVALNNGTLSVSSVISSARNFALTNTGTINTTANYTVSGNVTGSGGLTKIGTSVLIFSGSNSYSGATNVNIGTLRAQSTTAFSGSSEVTVASGATLDLNSNANTIANLSGAGNVTLGGAILTVGDANSTVFSGVISQTGGVTKVGSGLLNLTGTNSYTGATTVNGGTLAVNGIITSPTTVGAAGTLKGTGTIQGAVSVFGTTAPGNSIGTLHVVGDYTQESGSTFEVEIQGSATDNLTVTGSETIDSGATLDVNVYRGLYNANTPYEVITTTGGLSGTFTNITTSLDKLSVKTEYTATQLFLFLTIPSFSDIALSWNAKQVAKVLDRLITIDPPEWTNELDTLFYLSQTDLNTALNELDPAQLKGLSIIQQNNAVRVENAITLRFQNLMDYMRCTAVKGCRKNKRPFYVWVDGFNSRLRQPSNLVDTNPQVGYHSNTGGGFIGIDYNLFDYGYVGIMGGGTYSDVEWVNGQGSGHITSGYVGVYGSAITEKKFLNLSLLGATNSYHSSRNIIYPGVNQTARNTHRGAQLLTHVDGGLNFDIKGLTIRPFDSMEYIIQHEQAFHEEGAGVLDLDVQATNPQMFRNELGVQFAHCFRLSRKSRLIADLKLSWVNETRITGTFFTSSFVGFDSLTFYTEGYYPNRNFFSPGATITFNFACEAAYVTVSYDAEIGHHYLDQRTGAQFGIRF